MKVTTLWELTHINGSSIFVNHSSAQDMRNPMTFGPFLFPSIEDLRKTQGTQGPMRLLRALNGAPVGVQEVALPWIIENTARGFSGGPESGLSDCIVFGSGGLLLPLSPDGAVFADARLNDKAGNDSLDWVRPWSRLDDYWGPALMRTLAAKFMENLVDPGEPN